MEGYDGEVKALYARIPVELWEFVSYRSVKEKRPISHVICACIELYQKKKLKGA